MLLPVSRQTPTWSFFSRFSRPICSSDRQSLWFSTASRTSCRAATGDAKDSECHDDSANRRNAASVAKVSIPPTREHDRSDDARPGPLRRSNLGLEPIDVRVIARQRDDSFEKHRRGLGPALQSLGVVVVAHADTYLNPGDAEGLPMSQKAMGVRKTVSGRQRAIGGIAHGIRMDHESTCF